MTLGWDSDLGSLPCSTIDLLIDFSHSILPLSASVSVIHGKEGASLASCLYKRKSTRWDLGVRRNGS